MRFRREWWWSGHLHVRLHLLRSILSITSALLLAGCASCWTVPMLRPQASDGLGFSSVTDRNLDSLFLESTSIALWLRPCKDRSGADIFGSVCGTLIIPPKRRFVFESTEVQVLDLTTQQSRQTRLTPLDFKISEVEIGSGEPTSTSWLANRPYQLPGSWLGFRLFSPDEVRSPIEFRLPTALVDGSPVTFPPITLSPSHGQTCAHYH